MYDMSSFCFSIISCHTYVNILIVLKWSVNLKIEEMFSDIYPTLAVIFLNCSMLRGL